MTKRHRSAVTGEYVTAEQAKADPERTVSERVASEIGARWGEALSRIQALENAVVTLSVQLQTLEAAVAELRAGK